ncbi:MAG: hypothetical protein LBS35_13025 [Synergistaceae bacterium]|jgi:hypothetical protein|nr:hypothetical protein [Synergistaceae bacterium]
MDLKFFIKKTIKKTIKACAPYGIVILLRSIHDRNQYEKERWMTFGTINDDKIFYIIRRPEPGAGLFSNFHWVLGHIIYALERHYIPVVDMENYRTYFNENTLINGTKNAWEYYFKQPMNYNLDEAYKSKNVILSEMTYFGGKIPHFLEFEEQIEYFHKLILKYLQFNDITVNKIKEAKDNLFGDKKNIIGVKYRGTDYLKKHSKGHSIIAPINDYIDKTKKYFEEWKMDWIYLSTEAKEAVELFQKHFPDKLIVSENERIDNYVTKMGYSSEVGFGRKNDKYLRGLEYIVDTALLSECDAIIGPKVNGTFAALEFNGNKYKHKYIYSLGVN